MKLASGVDCRGWRRPVGLFRVASGPADHPCYARCDQRETAPMAEAKLAPNLPGWMVDHANRYLSSGGSEGHMYKMSPAGAAGDHGAVAAVDDDRAEVGGKVHLPAVLWADRQQLFRDRLERRRAGASGLVPQHPRQPGGRGSGRDQEDEGAARGPRRARNARGCGRSRWNSGRPTPTTRRKTEREIPVVVLDPVT